MLLTEASIDIIEDDHFASISADTFSALQSASAALTSNTRWQSVTVSSDMVCGSLDQAFEENISDDDQAFVVFPHGVYLRMTNQRVPEAEIEFEVYAADGSALITPEKHPR